MAVRKDRICRSYGAFSFCERRATKMPRRRRSEWADAKRSRKSSSRVCKPASEIINIEKREQSEYGRSINENRLQNFQLAFLKKANMKTIALIILLSCQLMRAETLNHDLPVLLDQLSKICTNRWNVSLSDDNEIMLISKEKALGEMPGDNYGPGEEEYGLYFRFKVVDAFNAKEADQARIELKKLRERGDKIEHREGMGDYSYFPKNQEEWALVVLIRRAERKVADIPEYRFKSVFLSVESSNDYFIPNKANPKAVQYKKDIEMFFKLLEKTGS